MRRASLVLCFVVCAMIVRGNATGFGQFCNTPAECTAFCASHGGTTAAHAQEWTNIPFGCVMGSDSDTHCWWNTNSASTASLECGHKLCAPPAPPELPVSVPEGHFTIPIGTAPPSSECVFPFTYNGVVYNECTGAGEAPPHPQSVHFSNQTLKYGWCSTTSQWEGKWGACGGCPKGKMGFPACQHTCFHECETCYLPEGKDVCSHSFYPNSAAEVANAGEFKYNGRRGCTSCPATKVPILMTTGYPSWHELTESDYQAYKIGASEVSYYGCWSSESGDASIGTAPDLGSLNGGVAVPALSIPATTGWLGFLNDHPSLPPISTYYVKGVVTRTKVANPYMTQRLNSEYASLFGVIHDGEEWFASCSNRKYVRCQDELSASGTETVRKCYVEKTSQCIKVETVCHGSGCQSGTTAGAIDIGNGGSSCALKQTLVPEYSQSSASSVFANDAMGHSHGQGKLDSPQGWSAATNAAGQYWQMDLGSAQSVGGVVTQGRTEGRTAHSQYVKSYQVQVSLDGSNWSYVDGGHAFTANSASGNDKVENLFASPVSTRFVRIVVQTWNNHISMRSGVLVCAAAAAVMEHLPVTDYNCYPRLPLVKTKAEWCASSAAVL